MLTNRNHSFHSQQSSSQKFFYGAVGAVRLVAADVEVPAGSAVEQASLIIVPVGQRKLVFASIAASVIAPNEAEAVLLVQADALAMFPPAEGWRDPVINLSCAGNFQPFDPAFG